MTHERNGIFVLITLFIDFFMVFSLNAAITEVGLLSVLILYALSYLGSFIDHSHHYHIQNYRTEEYLSNIGIGLSIILLGLCLFVPLNFLV